MENPFQRLTKAKMHRETESQYMEYIRSRKVRVAVCQAQNHHLKIIVIGNRKTNNPSLCAIQSESAEIHFNGPSDQKEKENQKKNHRSILKVTMKCALERLSKNVEKVLPNRH